MTIGTLWLLNYVHAYIVMYSNYEAKNHSFLHIMYRNNMLFPDVTRYPIEDTRVEDPF